MCIRDRFITVTVDICVQHGGPEALRCAGLSAAAEICWLSGTLALRVEWAPECPKVKKKPGIESLNGCSYFGNTELKWVKVTIFGLKPGLILGFKLSLIMTRGPTAWNSLPPALHDNSLSLNSFKQKLKTSLRATTAIIRHRLSPLLNLYDWR